MEIFFNYRHMDHRPSAAQDLVLRPVELRDYACQLILNRAGSLTYQFRIFTFKAWKGSALPRFLVMGQHGVGGVIMNGFEIF